MTDLHDRLEELTRQLDVLENKLQSVHDTPLAQLTDQASWVDKAKLDVTLAYAVHDLIWMHLKVNAVEPATHPVMQELGRIKEYFAKVKRVEGGAGPTDKPAPTSTIKLDKGAADRFIAAAIGTKGKHTRFTDNSQQEDDAPDQPEESTSPKQVEQSAVDTTTQGKRKQRPTQDPFAGYDEAEKQQSGKKKKKKNKDKSKK